MADDPVVAQLAAYNARDVDAFMRCFAEHCVVEDGLGKPLMSGAAEMRERYAAMFRDNPELHCELVHRTRVGPFVLDEERVTGRGPDALHAVAIYRVERGLIHHVRLLR